MTTATVQMIPTAINRRWTLLLPEHRAARGEVWDTWERERIGHMAANIHPGDCVFDIGAEEGDMPALWASWVGPGGGVVLVEPNPKVIPNIRAIWEANGLPMPLGIFTGFAGPEDDLRRPRWPEAFTSGHWPACADGPVIGNHGFANLCERPDIPRVRLDTLAAWTDEPDVITIDVEGAELEVLRGATRLLTDVHPLVYVSVHPVFMLEMYHQTAGELDAHMERFGYRRRELAVDHEAHWLYSHPEGRKVREP